MGVNKSHTPTASDSNDLSPVIHQELDNVQEELSKFLTKRNH